jgi:hypothetical protein
LFLASYSCRKQLSRSNLMIICPQIVYNTAVTQLLHS